MPDFRTRLETFLGRRGESQAFEQLTPDASTREYFRIPWRGSTAVACVYPEDTKAEQISAYTDVTALLRSVELPVAEIYDVDAGAGVVIQEDLGGRLLREELIAVGPTRHDELIDEAIGLIARIQAATTVAFERNSVASRLRFDREKLLWEHGFFVDNYFGELKGIRLPDARRSDLFSEFELLCRELESRASVLCHRDFHGANLMIDSSGNIRIIDHQDARIGTPSYDLVSLLLDRVMTPPPEEWLAAKRALLVDRRLAVGLPTLVTDEFSREFSLQTIQRGLKAVGTFSFQTAVKGRASYREFIGPALSIVAEAASRLGGFNEIEALTER
jgi:aminoglycoside/choline kinase family phosphotransferase